MTDDIDNYESFRRRWREMFGEEMGDIGFDVTTKEGRTATQENNRWLDDRRRRAQKNRETARTLIVSAIGIIVTSVVSSFVWPFIMHLFTGTPK